MLGEGYSDFVLLWLLCHQSRVEAESPSDCWLEKWSQSSRERGVRALDQLRTGVEDAITSLVGAFWRIQRTASSGNGCAPVISTRRITTARSCGWSTACCLYSSQRIGASCFSRVKNRKPRGCAMSGTIPPLGFAVWQSAGRAPGTGICTSPCGSQCRSWVPTRDARSWPYPRSAVSCFRTVRYRLDKPISPTTIFDAVRALAVTVAKGLQRS